MRSRRGQNEFALFSSFSQPAWGGLPGRRRGRRGRVSNIQTVGFDHESVTQCTLFSDTYTVS